MEFVEPPVVVAAVVVVVLFVGDESSGTVVVVVVGVVAEVVVVDSGTVVVGQSINAAAALTGSGVDEPVLGLFELLFELLALFELFAVLPFVVLAGVTLELVCPSIRCRTVIVADSCTDPSTLSVVVRSPRLTMAVLKIEGAAVAAVALGLRLTMTAPTPPTKARQHRRGDQSAAPPTSSGCSHQLPLSASVGGRRAARAAG